MNATGAEGAGTSRHEAIVTAIFPEVETARAAAEALREDGFPPEGLGLLVRDRRERPAVAEVGGKAGPGAAAGAIGGGLVGAVGGWMVGVGALVLPGIGPVVAGGVVATALGTAGAGAAAGAAVGGLVGTLVGMGVPEERARALEREVGSGRVLLTVRTDEPARAVEIIEANHGSIRGGGGSDAPDLQKFSSPEQAPLSGHLPGSFGVDPMKRRRR